MAHHFSDNDRMDPMVIMDVFVKVILGFLTTAVAISLGFVIARLAAHF